MNLKQLGTATRNFPAIFKKTYDKNAQDYAKEIIRYYSFTV